MSPPKHMRPTQLILLDLITRKIFAEEYVTLSSGLGNLLHSRVTPFLLDPNILLSTLFSKILILRSSLHVGDPDSQPNKTT